MPSKKPDFVRGETRVRFEVIINYIIERTAYYLLKQHKFMYFSALFRPYPDKREFITQITRIVKLTTVLLIVAGLQVSAAGYSQKITIKGVNIPIHKVFEEVKKQTNYQFFYADEILANLNNVSLNVERGTVVAVLDSCFRDQALTYTISENVIFIKKKIPAPQPAADASPAAIKVKGTVTDDKGRPLEGATILIKGTNHGTKTDANGNFTITAAPNSILVISYVGSETTEINIGNRSAISVALNPSSASGDQIVIVGYGTQKKVTVTGAISSISGTTLLESPQANISNALAGRLPGLLAVQRSGEPGNDASTIRIRGIGTFSGSADPLVMVDGIESENYNNIDPNEIENISILKDVSATAVYGVRGANGVVLITTKRGKVGKAQVSYSSNFALTSFTNVRKDMNSYDYARSYNDALKYDSYESGVYTPRYSDDAIAKYKSNEDPLFYPNVDWEKLMFRSFAPQMEHNLNFRGGTKDMRYFVSAGYFSQEGMLNNTNYSSDYDAQLKYKRYNFRSNFDFNITKGLTANIDMSSQIEDRISPGSWSTASFMSLVLAVNPLNYPGMYDGKIVTLGDPSRMDSPLYYLLSRGYQSTNDNYLKGSARLNYLLDFITRGLSIHGTISYNNFNSDGKQYYKSLVYYKPERLPDNSVVFLPNGVESPFQFSENKLKNRKTYAEFGIDYARSFGDHNVTGLLLYNESKRFDPTLAYQVPNGYQGVAGRVTYNYKHRYLAEFDIGYNGTENFAPGKRFGIFPAYSVGWVASDESFFPKNDYVSFLKFKGSFGEVGNDKIGGDRFLYLPSSYGYAGGYFFGQAGSSYNYYTGSFEGRIGNPDLTWERAKKADVGAELRLLRDKIKIEGDVFTESRDNILASQGTIPAFVGATLPVYNLGKMKNSGFDGSITYNDRIGKVNYWINFNYTYAHNVVEYQDEVKFPYAYQQATGQRFGQFFGLIAEGFYNTWQEVNDANRPALAWQNNQLQPGDVRYKDVNGDGIINSNDAVPIGYSNFPEKIFGLSFGGEFKGFSVSILLQAATNVSIQASKKSIRGFAQNFGTVDYLLNGSWTQERYEAGSQIDFPHLTVDNISNNYQNSSLWITDASYLRLKNVEVGYTFTGSILKKIGIGSARVYASGSNLLTWDKMFPGVDPESPNDESLGIDNASYPTTRILNLGINIKF